MSELVEALSASHKLEYRYKRSVGPIMGQFFTALRDEARILGVRREDGSVMCPPKEYDPETAGALSEMVEVGPAGEVVSWAWVKQPRAKQPCDHPFAFALIKLDGADTPMLHAVDSGSEELMATGMRVTARFAPERVGHITDIACFEPLAADAGGTGGA